MQGHFLIFTQPMPNATDHNSPTTTSMQLQLRPTHATNKQTIKQQVELIFQENMVFYISKTSWCFFVAKFPVLHVLFWTTVKLSMVWWIWVGWSLRMGSVVDYKDHGQSMGRAISIRGRCTKNPSGSVFLIRGQPLPHFHAGPCLCNLAIIHHFHIVCPPHISENRENAREKNISENRGGGELFQTGIDWLALVLLAKR